MIFYQQSVQIIPKNLDDIAAVPTYMLQDSYNFLHPRVGRGISDVAPTVWNLRAVGFIPLFYISSLVLLPSPFAVSVLSFWPILLTYFSLNLHIPKGRLFCVALV